MARNCRVTARQANSRTLWKLSEWAVSSQGTPHCSSVVLPVGSAGSHGCSAADFMKTAIAIRHVAFEDLGVFEPVLRDGGYAIRYCDMGLDDPTAIDPKTDLLVVLGGPIGAYEDGNYPFI